MTTSLIPVSVEVLATPTTLRRSTAGGITGLLWVRLTSADRPPRIVDFPEANWSDFPVVVLGWWLGQLARPIEGKEALARCHFMDGPHEFAVHRRHDQPLWELRLPGNRPSMVAGNQFLRALVDAARGVLQSCEGQGWGGSDVDALARAIEQGEQYAAA